MRGSEQCTQTAERFIKGSTDLAMIWFLIESGVALLLLVVIVWWTMPRNKGKGDRKDPRSGD